MTRVKWKLVSVRFEIVLISTQDRSRFAPNAPLAQKSVWMHLMALLGDVFKWRLIAVCLEIVLTSMQDRCTICAKRIIGSEISLDAPNGTPR